VREAITTTELSLAAFIARGSDGGQRLRWGVREASRDFFNRSTGSSRQTDDVHMGTLHRNRLSATGTGP
jgi:hypothetical protein